MKINKILNIKFIKNSTTEKKISITVPKSVFKKATKRNDLRRKGYLLVQKYLDKLPEGFLGMFIFNKKIGSEEIEHEIKNIFDKVH